LVELIIMNHFSQEQYIAHLSIDCVIFGFQNKELKVLVSKFKYGKDLWGLPGGYILKTESIEKAAARILKERTSLEKIYLEQFKVFGNEKRIIRSPHRSQIRKDLLKYKEHLFSEGAVDWMTDRFICIGFYALVDINKIKPKASELDEKLEWKKIAELPELTHDHQEIVEEALQALRNNLDQKLIGFNLLPETFTMREVQELYEAIYSKPFARNNFQKKILDLQVLERLEKKFTGAQNKAPYLYRFIKKTNQTNCYMRRNYWLGFMAILVVNLFVAKK